MLLFRLISERTVEENILKKANQKRMLGDMAIEGGNFTTAFFKQVGGEKGRLLVKCCKFLIPNVMYIQWGFPFKLYHFMWDTG